MELLMANPGTFGDRLKARRNEMGFTLARLSEAVGIHLQSLAKIESGDRPNPTWDTVIALCSALDVTPDYFYDPPADQPADDVDPDPRPLGKRK